MKKILTMMLGILVVLGSMGKAWAMGGVITADNHYGLYYGGADGSGLSFVGRNEIGPAGSPGTFDWSEAETWSFNPNPIDRLYVLAWNSAALGLPNMWIGDFTLPDTSKLFSDLTHWEYYVSPNPNPDISGLPTLSNLAAEISSAAWATPGVSAPQGTAPWGTIAGISPSAEFIWHDTFDLATFPPTSAPESSSSFHHYAVFRTTGPVGAVIPEPMTLTLMGAGLSGMFFARRKKVNLG